MQTTALRGQKRSFPRSQFLTLSDHSARGSFDHLPSARARAKTGTEVRILLWNLAARSAFQRYGMRGGPLPTSIIKPMERESHGTVLATRSALNGSNRPVPRARTAAQEIVVCRAVAP